MGRKTILIIDDSKEVINLCEAILEQSHRVIGANSGREGIRKAMVEVPDLILLDLHLGDTDGFEICRKLSEIESTREIPICIISVSRDDQSVAKASRLGVVDFIAKPIIPSYLSKRVQTILERYSGKMIRCPSCFKSAQPDWIFCPYDGTRLKTATRLELEDTSQQPDLV